MTGENKKKDKELTEEQKNAKKFTAKAMEDARQAREAKLEKSIRTINVNKGGKVMKPITMNMGGQVEGVEDLTTEFEVTD